MALHRWLFGGEGTANMFPFMPLVAGCDRRSTHWRGEGSRSRFWRNRSSGSGLRILVVDHAADTRIALARLLGAEGYDVHAVDGAFVDVPGERAVTRSAIGILADPAWAEDIAGADFQKTTIKFIGHTFTSYWKPHQSGKRAAGGRLPEGAACRWESQNLPVTARESQAAGRTAAWLPAGKME